MIFQIEEIASICTVNVTNLYGRLLSYNIIYQSLTFVQKTCMLNTLIRHTENNRYITQILGTYIIKVCALNLENLESVQALAMIGFDPKAHVTIVNTLIKNSTYSIPTLRSIDFLEFLIETGANVNCVNNKGVFPLLLAATNSKNKIYMKTLKLLIRFGANIDLQSPDDGETALMSAITNLDTTASIESVKYLISSGTNINLQDSDGETPLMLAARYSNTTSSIECVNILIRSGADLDITDNDGQTALKYACLYSNSKSSIECVKILLNAGAKLDKYIDGMDDILLMCQAYASIGGHSSFECFKLVADLVDINSTDKYGNTTLMRLCLDTESNIDLCKNIYTSVNRFRS